jgi:SAM-dependent methyltransferase
MPQEHVTPPSDPLFGTHKPAIVGIWNQMQRIQTDFAFAQELSFYHTSPRWHSAKTVLDIGTGNGYYLSKLAAHFPDRVYHGVDSSAELIAIAEKEAGSRNVSFANRSVFDITEPYDFILMRLVLQHLNDIPAALDHIGALVTPGKAAGIIDACDPLRFFYPDFPEFTAFFAAYTEHERKAGRDRRVSSCVQQAVASSGIWRLGGTLQLLIPSTIPGNLDRFTRTYMLLLDLVEQAGELQYDFAAVRAAWQIWSKTSRAYMQVGLNLIQLDRI